MPASAPDPRRPARGRLAAAADWTFRDRETGGITVAQRPNPSLLLALGCAAAAGLAGRGGGPPGPVGGLLRGTAEAALAWWAVREVAQGVNPWRRGLGAAALTGLALRRTRARPEVSEPSRGAFGPSTTPGQ